MNRIIDLRSDTITKPCDYMKRAMEKAEVGDDVYKEDPTVKLLEEKVARMFGMEASLFCVSGTMSNQLAIKAHTSPGNEVICDKSSHIYLYEGGGISVNSLCSVKPLDGDYGIISAELLKGAINNADDIHQPISRLVSLENTTNRGGGAYYDFEEIKKIKEVCQKNNLKLHLDGARLFNALVETPQSPEDYGRVFDSISICLSKGLGCPVGSVIIGDRQFIEKTRRLRKLMGGGWRQAGSLAAAGIYALDNNIQLLKEDHRRAKQIGEILQASTFAKEVLPIATNIVMMIPADGNANEFVVKMKERNILCTAFGDQLVRFVSHLDISDSDLEDFKMRISMSGEKINNS
ncbi:threonine aldolase family protein [Chryseobacterium sp. RU33C]|uniref:threonine aldolase family protein n=1 Tax=Chryseobacterium sp. RU33C TaxID=1907398 RepID=UPI000956A92E|nr:GntG family PLP-dependent aldolase [Chryseobacterium sp. RU33C]SIR56098.1 L-threonine aldolase [Chryseobacterium sp. RU33C]